MSNPNQWLFEAPYTLDAMTAPPLQSHRGGRKGRARTDISPWPSLLQRAIAAIQAAMRHLAPVNFKEFDKALLHAESLLRSAMREVQRVMSGSRQFDVLDQLSNAVTRIKYAGAQARGRSIHGGQSLIDPRISLQGAIHHIQFAQRAVGLK